ncbi:hypothetical protein MMC18_006390 [Xylographa bjoerkii]|nr:hypothetical protein [Xylographa bjoerkii]
MEKGSHGGNIPTGTSQEVPLGGQEDTQCIQSVEKRNSLEAGIIARPADYDAQGDAGTPAFSTVVHENNDCHESGGPTSKSQMKEGEPIVEGRPRIYVTGWRLHLLTFALCLSLLLSTLETTIVSTSLVSITNALKDYEQSGWVVTSYLLTYTGFLIIYAKFSDIFGRKPLILTALVIFTTFSITCGTSQTMLELIVFRSLQGAGGSGIYSMVTVIAPDMVPPERYGLYMGIVSSVFAIASVLGPILGGAISDHSTWRWVFLLNAPAGAVTIALIAFALPANFPYGNLQKGRTLREIFSKQASRRLDVAGAALSLAASVLLVFALEQAGTVYAWNSPAIVCSFVASGLLLVIFIGWENIVEKVSNGLQEPIIPGRLFRKRVFVGLILNAFFTGFPFVSAIINIPQRFQEVNGASPSGAGFRLLPLLLCSPLASGLAGVLVTKLKVPPHFLLMFASSLQLVGVGLMSNLSTTNAIATTQYGYEVILGFGFGFGLSTLLIMAPVVVEKRDLGNVWLRAEVTVHTNIRPAVAMGAITQIRVLGGTIGLALCSTILNNQLKTSLLSVLGPAQLRNILDSTAAVASLEPVQQVAVQTAFATGFNKQMRIMIAFTAAAFLSTLLIWERKPRRTKSN